MKVFAYVGSYRGEKSYSRYIVTKLVSEIFINNDYDFYLYSPDNIHIRECQGCCGCFLSGNCIINDDMGEVKQKMIESDIIIFASPVYAHQVSGSFKTFIDRISYWTHTMELCGKIGISLSISDNNGNDYVTDYIREIMLYLGVAIADDLKIEVRDISKEGLDSIIRVKGKKIRKIIEEKNYSIDVLQETFYSMNRNAILSKIDKTLSSYEEKKWKNNKVYDFVDFKSFYDSKSTFK